jgi:hypothetical protein
MGTPAWIRKVTVLGSEGLLLQATVVPHLALKLITVQWRCSDQRRQYLGTTRLTSTRGDQAQ